MKNINADCVDYNQKDVYYQTRNTVMMETIVRTTVGIDHCQDGNRCQDRDPCQDGDEHADGQNNLTVLMHQSCTQCRSISLL